MQSFRFLLLAVLGLLVQSRTFAQLNYHAGTGSGTDGTYNVFVGPYSGRITIGSGNSFLGTQAGYSNTEGSYNSFVGYAAGYKNTSGNFNSFLGSFAGYSNTTGSDNSFLGAWAGYSNKTGHDNSFLGNGAGYSNKTGHDNSFLGNGAGYSNTTGSANSFLGRSAGQANTTGFSNSFLGYNAGVSNKTGSCNSIVGDAAGYWNKTGSNNSFLGYQAGYSNQSGYKNSFVGNQAGYQNTTGSANSFLGYASGYNNTTSSFNSFLGTYAGFSNTTGNINSFLGYQAGYKNTTGSFNLFLGAYSDASANNFSYAGAIGYRAYVSASNSLVLGSINGVNGATASMKVGIGTTAPGYLLHVNGDAAKPGGGSWTVASDQRLKQGITDFQDGLAVVEKIRPVWFRYNGKAGLPKEKKYVGVIAQEMQQIAPYTVGEFVYTDTTGKQEQYLDYDANALTYLLVNAVKEVDRKYAQQLKEKDAQIASIQKELADIKALLLKEPTTATSEWQAAQLWQNEPNPTDGSTVIRYRIPQAASRAQLKLFSSSGQEWHSFDLTDRGEGRLTLPAHLLSSGTYVYHLVVDGKRIDAKKLLTVK